LLSAKKPETIELEDYGVVIHGRGFAKQAEFDNFVPDYPPARSGRCNIGLLHTSLDGREGHASYAPCSLADLRSKGYDYWALGHIHQRQIVAEEGNLALKQRRAGQPIYLLPTRLQTATSGDHRFRAPVSFRH
jgi:DNA repair exonuclease SbcCD nuclease subunit